eukprot:CAMPEP_0201690678 /NCGR_PEP_ID=MMETSP0578-20130828/4055_1 /ASSEMBLY_ACC=CAM_ASM_000663 /TAXON_ID=267565 /ORGANISM="Skeletonema grethea, Strain CCMP 1804" /LENGTH=694 /DNA_ID=CAMNT_0048175725 /DNA_START=96 /DNA_END=2180 /DNA_ORIENTATION=-
MSGRDRFANSTRPPPRGGPNYNDRGGRPTRSAPPRNGGGPPNRSNNNYGGGDDAPIDPNMPDWWNAKKKAERRQREEERRMSVREDMERSKMGYAPARNNGRSRGNTANNEGRGNARVVAVGGSDNHDTAYSRKVGASSSSGVGARHVSDFDDTKGDDSDKRQAALRKKMFLDGGAGAAAAAGGDERLRKIATAEEELEGRSLMDLVDRGTLMVGCCLILIVVIAVTIPVALISEDEPYVAPPVPDPPSASPTMARQQVYWDIFDRVQRVAGGPDVLSDPNTAQNRALNWIVYEDGMELGPGKDHLHQRFVLMVIYFISGPWTPVEGRLEWGSPVHECEWEGIFCKDVEELEAELEGKISELLESGREDGVKIDVPQRIINRLELRQRLVSGEVPGEFSLLYYLQHLDLENNQLVGALPSPLYKLFNLQTLFLEQNQLTNIDAIGEYRYLEHLSVSKNAFQGPLPESFKQLKYLKTLYLHTNAFTGQVFDILKDFKKLELLDLAFNKFEGTLPAELGEMSNLTSVFLGHNEFKGTIPVEIGRCPNLKEFQIDASHKIGGPIPTEFGRLTNLEFLKLDTCAFNGTLPKELAECQKLYFLDVNSNELGGPIPSEYGRLGNMKTLGLANNDFIGTIPAELSQMATLEKAYFQNTDLQGDMPQEICNLRDRGNQTVLEELVVPCDVECQIPQCCTRCS